MSNVRVTAKAERSGSWWAVEVPEIPGLFTQARRLDLVPSMVIEAASLLDVELEPDDVAVDPQLSEADALSVGRARQASIDARYVASIAYDASREAVARLRGDGLSVRDVATLMGLSPQRVSAIENEPKADPAAGTAATIARVVAESGSIETVGRVMAEAAAFAAKGGAVEQIGPRGGRAIEKVGPRAGVVEVRSKGGKGDRRIAQKP